MSAAGASQAITCHIQASFLALTMLQISLKMIGTLTVVATIREKRDTKRELVL